MAICQVCGCKTDELDFVEGHIGGLEKKVCSFCHRQLKNLDGESVGEAHLKWLSAVVGKDVPEREEEVFLALKGILEKHGVQQEISVPVPNADLSVKAYNVQEKAENPVSADEKDRLIAELTDRVDKLEKTVILMKRSQIIKMICEIAIPVILGIIILIVFFSSGFYNTLSDLYSSFS